jgi:hypothetical protein
VACDEQQLDPDQIAPKVDTADMEFPARGQSPAVAGGGARAPEHRVARGVAVDDVQGGSASGSSSVPP